jgi:hypothetical protein
MHCHFHFANLRQNEVASFQRHSLRQPKTIVFELPFQFRIAGAAGEEVFEGCLQVAKRLLETLRRNFFHEVEGRFEIHKLPGGGMVIQTPLLAAKGPTLLEGEVIHQARATGRPGEQHSLFDSRQSRNLNPLWTFMERPSHEPIHSGRHATLLSRLTRIIHRRLISVA